MSVPGDQLLPIAAAAAFLGIRPRALGRWVILRRIAPVRDAKGNFRFRKSDLLAARERYEYGDPSPRQPAELG